MKVALIAFAAAGLLTVASVAGCGGTGGTGAVAPINNSVPAHKAVHPNATPTPIQLVLGGTIGDVVFPDGDTATGGQGQSIQGINCRKELLNKFHHHVQLSMFVNGEEIALPKGTGMKNPGHNQFIYHADCFYFLHTHDQTGIIHIEPRTETTYTLKNYFAVWGMPLSTNGFAGYTGQVAVYINGTLQPGLDPTTVTLTPFELITLVIGTPPAWIPNYIFPAGYTLHPND
jgi:hypothetical protein